VYDDYASLVRASDFHWVNEKELEIPGYLGLGPGPYEGNTGFPVFVAPPKIVFDKKNTDVFDKKNSRPPLDFYRFGRIWLISDRLKAILEEFDRDGFQFVRTETLYEGGTHDGPPFWFCDVIRVLDCVDEAASTVNYQKNARSKRYATVVNVVMRPEAVGSAHVLRLRYYTGRVLVDDVFRNMVHAHKVRGFGFIPLDGSNRRAML
jgi:hypothetical protein